MPNTINIQDLIVAEGLRILTNELVFTNKISRAYEDKFNLNVQDHRTGPTIRIPKPVRTSVRTGWTMQTQNAVEEVTSLTIDTVKGDDFAFTDADMALLIPDPDKNMAQWSKRFLKPRISRLANEIDKDIFAKAYVTVPNLVGTPGTVPQSYRVITQAVQALDDNLAPQDDRTCILGSAAKGALADALKGTYVKEISGQALLKGFISDMDNVEFFMSQNVPSQTVGNNSSSTPLINGANQVGSTIDVDGWATTQAVIKKGDIFTIDGVYQVNPVTGATYANLQQFVATADTSSISGETLTLPIFPSIITSGPTQTVSASPANNAALTIVGTASTLYTQNLMFHKDAFTMAFAKLHNPGGMEKTSQATYDGFTMRYVRGYDIVNAQVLDRLDVYYGFASLYPLWACRITN